MEQSSKQVVVVHGGDSYKSQTVYEDTLRSREVLIERMRPAAGWKLNLQADVGNSIDVIAPSMPLADNARYRLWKVWFERLLPLLDDELVLIGHSLGGIFLAKFLAEQETKKTVSRLVLVAAPFVADTRGELPIDWMLPEDLSGIMRQAKHVSIYHSEDDPVVPYEDAKRYAASLSGAKLYTLEGRGHINDAHFPELAKELRKI